MKKNHLSKQEERALLELECQLARLKIRAARQRAASASRTPAHINHLVHAINEISRYHPVWKSAMLYRRSKQKWWLGAGWVLWRLLFSRR